MNMLSMPIVVAVVLLASPASARCLKADGDWLDGVTRRACLGKDVRGQWIAPKQKRHSRPAVRWRHGGL